VANKILLRPKLWHFAANAFRTLVFDVVFVGTRKKDFLNSKYKLLRPHWWTTLAGAQKS